MADGKLHYMTNVMILTLQSSTFLFYIVTYHFHLLMYISQLTRYARACFAYEDFSIRDKLITKTLMLQGYNESRLKSSFHKFYSRYIYNDIVCDFKLSMAHMLNELFHTLC
jgi:hypothetical protein